MRPSPSTPSVTRTPVSSVGVVVPCKNEVATIRRCLRALREQDPPVAAVVVVDNGSTDGSLDVARELADIVLELPDVSISELRNAGVRELPPVDAVAFVDADTEVAGQWLRAGLAALAEGADLVGSRSAAASDARWVARSWAHVEATLSHDGSHVWSQQLLIRSSLFTALGGFADIATGEDADLSIRAAALGASVRIVPDMHAVHHGFPGDLRGFLRREKWHTRATGWFPRMSPSSRLLVLGAAGWTVMGGVAALRVRRSPAPLRAWAAASALAVPAMGSTTSRRPSRALQDGFLLALWIAVRVARLPREMKTLAGG